MCLKARVEHSTKMFMQKEDEKMKDHARQHISKAVIKLSTENCFIRVKLNLV